MPAMRFEVRGRPQTASYGGGAMIEAKRTGLEPLEALTFTRTFHSPVFKSYHALPAP